MIKASFNVSDKNGFVCVLGLDTVISMRTLLNNDHTGLELTRSDIQKIFNINRMVEGSTYLQDKVLFLLSNSQGAVKFELQGEWTNELAEKFLVNSFMRLGLDQDEARYQSQPCSGYEPAYLSGCEKLKSLGYSDTFMDFPLCVGMTEEMMTLIIEG